MHPISSAIYLSFRLFLFSHLGLYRIISREIGAFLVDYFQLTLWVFLKIYCSLSKDLFFRHLKYFLRLEKNEFLYFFIFTFFFMVFVINLPNFYFSKSCKPKYSRSILWPILFSFEKFSYSYWTCPFMFLKYSFSNFRISSFKSVLNSCYFFICYNSLSFSLLLSSFFINFYNLDSITGIPSM